MVSNPDYPPRTSLFCIKRRRCFIVRDERPQGVRKYVEVEADQLHRIAHNPNVHSRGLQKRFGVQSILRNIPAACAVNIL